MNHNPIKICILAGENSGDQHGAKLIIELKKKFPKAEFYGTGGQAMETQGVQLISHIKDLAMMGFSGATKVIPNAINTYRKLKKIWRSSPPDFVIPIDYGGFNLRICKVAFKLKIPVYYYIPPKIWAWNQKRVNKLKLYTKLAFVINPFELNFYTEKGVNAIYVGNPSAYEIANYSFDKSFKQNNGFSLGKKLIGIFPGSRQKEVERMTPIFLDAAQKYFDQNPNTEFAICQPTTIEDSFYKPFLGNRNFTIKVIKNKNYDLMKSSDFLILKSGTTTLEAGLIGTPMIVCYVLDSFTYALAKLLVKVPFVSLVNLNLGNEAVKELIQNKVTSENIVNEMQEAMLPENYSIIKSNLLKLLQISGKNNPAQITAESIYKDFTQC
jgi:lipid-A-disaccharide synthase